ncbi:hypothetical protein HRI_002663000 [Hibiscus trionum]|uniref:Retroviral polymerase SH3-like domain-containing protein n=1 Tax=Hibiscus trionum TaxID=183268 RepID=A0A9W7I6C5_HIBTR|nr:hypothetical protein HRI_002663000 [Hibiscus trionum]
MGYSLVQKGYVLFNLESKAFFVSRDVVFHESIFPFTFPVKFSCLFPPSSYTNLDFLDIEYVPYLSPIIDQSDNNGDMSLHVSQDEVLHTTQSVPTNDLNDVDMSRDQVGPQILDQSLDNDIQIPQAENISTTTAYLAE